MLLKGYVLKIRARDSIAATELIEDQVQVDDAMERARSKTSFYRIYLVFIIVICNGGLVNVMF